ncbi:MAG: hypothetical protein GX639_18455 [Fibrobacter sp.]|nr:hypothetical protein [Fibrobacter sp.]
MSILKKISLAVATVAVLSTSSFAANVIVGGNVPLINSITGLGVLTLDLSSAGNAVNIAKFIVNCNAPTMDVTWALTNEGEFLKEGAAATTGVEFTAVLEAGGVAEGLGDPLGGGDLTPNATAVNVDGANTTWNYNQTSATENFVISMNATWTEPAGLLAGLYTETITFTIAASGV